MSVKLQIILASASPRRKELLRLLGQDFIVDPACVDETVGRSRLAPKIYALKNALLKAKTVAERHPQKVVLGVDTIGVLGGKILEKPSDPEDARKMLRALSGKKHTVYSAVALVHAATKKTMTAIEKTTVTFRILSRAEIAAYVATGEPMDKAAAYAIQGGAAVFVKAVHGDYTNIIGLPVTLFVNLRDKMEKHLQKATKVE